MIGRHSCSLALKMRRKRTDLRNDTIKRELSEWDYKYLTSLVKKSNFSKFQVYFQ